MTVSRLALSRDFHRHMVVVEQRLPPLLRGGDRRRCRTHQAPASPKVGDGAVGLQSHRGGSNSASRALALQELLERGRQRDFVATRVAKYRVREAQLRRMK